MPRIRKSQLTTRRGTTNQREKIKHKVAETKKKRKKAEKKNQQWKTRHPKDPGIPNNFPYKDQILAEVAQERRRVCHAAAPEGHEHSSAAQEQADATDDDIPVLANRNCLTCARYCSGGRVVQVLDARDPLRCRSASLEEAPRTRTEDVDACPREAVQEWATSLRAQHPTVLFRSASVFLPTAAEPTGKGKDKERADDAWGVDSVMQVLGSGHRRRRRQCLVVAVVGLTNAGKSSFINCFLRKAALPTYKLTSSPQDGPTTTAYPQETSLETEGKRVRIIDTPGLAWQTPSELSADELERLRARDILQRNRGKVERLKDPAPVVAELVSRADKEDLMLFYNLPAFAAGDANAFLAGVARANGLVKKGGVLDLAVASRIVLRDWSTGKFPRYTRPPSAPSTVPAQDGSFADVYAKNDEILSRLDTRKEMRKSRGTVRMSPGEVESREVALEIPYFGVDQDEDQDEDDDNDEVDELEESGEDVEDDEDEENASDEDADDEEEPAPAPGKRKRAGQKSPPRAVKKVAFAAEPKGTKQARSAAGSKPSVAKTKQDTRAQAKVKPAPKAKPVKTQKTPSVAAAMKKIANSSKKAKQPSASKDGEETYDFSKFF
ncbi:GNL3L/Grn1 putative GTPase-domain-containing protein [Fomitopsis serialis]|uniref:GNL3L/Grn1 putative GTPase-domain-containing protein n=1 Tax=Fomitopsis serialis TaxID=139415 RepID=UPI002007597C|nr:GNL3L/Grn1 putative GTPase-domain-containing protein [Neoantrodia serialis]KAH9938725.1 GNL3L/Grn1 putative GTPase-domain-containing protein [Neoantrodia serialis]